MKDKKGFTLIELLAVIVILSVILAIAGTAVINSINDSKEKTRFLAASDIVEMASAYMATTNEDVIKIPESYKHIIGTKCIFVSKLVEKKYLESDITNPETGKNISNSSELSAHRVCVFEDEEKQSDYKLQSYNNGGVVFKYDYYSFDGYRYEITK